MNLPASPDTEAPPDATVGDPNKKAGGAALARNTLFNLAGQVTPLLVAVVAIPLLVDGLGTERFGVLTIAWVFLGYFSLFDLGMSRAVTQMLARLLSRGEHARVPGLLWTALGLSFLLGLVGGAVTAGLAGWVVRDFLSVPPALQGETLRALYALAASVPVVIGTANLRGVLEAVQRFDVINAIRIPMGVFTFIGPLAVLPFSSSLFDVVLVLVAGRVLFWGIHAFYVARVVPEMRRGVALERAWVRPLLRFGGWMTVSNVVSPLMVYMDRFLIGAVLSMAAVAYYATPWEVVTKLLVVPTAVSAVLFPAFSYWHGRDGARTARFYFAGMKAIALVLFPAALLLVVLARPGLALWLGAEYADPGFRPMQLLAIGVLINATSSIPYALVQGAGRPDLTAKMHVVQLPLYLAALFALMHAFGITGVALAWLLRMVLDAAMLTWMSRAVLHLDAAEYRRVLLGIAAAVAVLGLAMLPEALPARLALAAAAIPGAVLLGWRYWLAPDERAFLREKARRRGAA